MYLPSTYDAQLTLMLLSMVLWGSWANTVKLTPGWPFQAFYWDYVLGVGAGSLLWGFLLGGEGFLAQLTQAATSAMLLGIAAGIVFNIANQLLIAAIDLAGLAVAFPVGIGIALLEGVILNYWVSPAANAVLLAAGVVFVAVAIVLDAVAYRRREQLHPKVSRLGLVLSVISGLLMGLFYPVLTRAMQGPNALGPYSVVPFFAIGVGVCALIVNTWISKRPFTGEPVSFSAYTRARLLWHLWGLIGGVIWDSGLQSNLLASRARLVGPAVSYAIGQGATMVSAIWGVFIWREFRNADWGTLTLLTLMFLFFLAGLTLIALAPTHAS